MAMALLLIVSALPVYGLADALEVTKLPQLTADNLKQIMTEQMAAYKTKDNVVPMLWQGFLEMDIRVDETIRTAKVYVPEGCVQGPPFIIMNVPEGMDSLTFIRESGWMQIADQEEMPLFILEPAEGTSWGTVEEEMPYVVAACAAQKAGTWLNPGLCRYVVGYGEIGSAPQMFVEIVYI